tara:strand:- start:1656 stop:1988 length:333 start_codon:yes stop_codon:yes gene_type:complete
MTNSLDGDYLQPDSKDRGSMYGSRLFPKVMQKPIGVGSFVGLLTGVANSVILTIPLLFSVPVGILLGMAVCIIACPNMRNDLAQHTKDKQQTRQQLLARKGRKNAFTMYE